MNAGEERVAVYTFSHVGQRDENQDRLAVFGPVEEESRLFVVADGLGGHGGGALAAESVVNAAGGIWPPGSQDPECLLRCLVQECHAAVRRTGSEHDLDARSTVAALLLSEEVAMSVHVGDSRVMQFSERSLVGQTSDHSLAQLLVSRGELSERDAAGHASQAQLLSSVGGPTTPSAEVNHWDLSCGTRFVVCSDGFWSIFSHAEVPELFDSAEPEADMRQQLESKLERLQHHDNCTAILVEIIRSIETGTPVVQGIG